MKFYRIIKKLDRGFENPPKLHTPSKNFFPIELFFFLFFFLNLKFINILKLFYKIDATYI